MGLTSKWRPPGRLDIRAVCVYEACGWHKQGAEQSGPEENQVNLGIAMEISGPIEYRTTVFMKAVE